MTKRLNPYTVYLILVGASSLFYTVVFTIASVYRVTTVGLSPLQLVLVGTALEAAVFLFEIPTGVVADLYSRRLSIVVGFTIIGIAFIIQGSIPLFLSILLTEALWGVGYTFTSGAQEAWIADEIGQARAGIAYLRGAQVGQVGSLAGILISVALASVQLQLPILIGGGLFIALSLFLLLAMTERGFRPAPRAEHSPWQGMLRTLQSALAVIRRQPVFLAILAIGAIYGMSSEAMDRLWEAHLLRDLHFPALGQLRPVVWFGIINVVERLLGIGAVEVARRRVDPTSHRAVAGFLLASNALLMVSVIGFGLAGHFELALATYWTARLARSVHGPLYTTWVNQRIDDAQVRATIISAASQTDALGQILGGPIVGAIGNLWSINAAIVAAGAILSPVLILYRLAIRQGRTGSPHLRRTQTPEAVKPEED